MGTGPMSQAKHAEERGCHHRYSRAMVRPLIPKGRRRRERGRGEREGGERAGHLPDKGFGIKVGALVWKIHTRHGIEVVGALDVAE